MRHVLIIGAGGQIARHAIGFLGGREGIALTLLLRDAAKLAQPLPANARVVEADVMDAAALAAAMAGQDLVYVNTAGEVDAQVARIIDAMRAAAVARIVLVNSLGIHDEVPGAFGRWNRREIGAYLGPYRRAADLLAASGLDYTNLRAAWLTDEDEIDFETTDRDQPFRGTEVSRKSVAAVVRDIVLDPRLHSMGDVGVNKPGSDGDKPRFL
jgi:uncharacterized protein YbjT (DUF2867 family)